MTDRLPYYLLNSDALDTLRSMPDNYYHCVVTSPPYWRLRDYQVDGQIGMESTLEDYIAKMVQVFSEVRRVLRPDGTLWLNMGDKYVVPGDGRNADGSKTPSGKQTTHTGSNIGKKYKCTNEHLKPKNLYGLPWRVAFALQADGWILRQDIIWHKTTPMPESVTDRCTKAHEYIFLLSKSQRYYYNANAIKEPVTGKAYRRSKPVGGWAMDSVDHRTMNHNIPKSHNGSKFHTGKMAHGKNGVGEGPRKEHLQPRADDNYSENNADFVEVRNKRSVWTITSKGYSGTHFATFPLELVENCIKAGCPPGGRVLDPFAGSGTTLEVAMNLGCEAHGIELSAEYCDLIRNRLAPHVTQPDFVNQHIQNTTTQGAHPHDRMETPTTRER